MSRWPAGVGHGGLARAFALAAAVVPFVTATAMAAQDRPPVMERLDGLEAAAALEGAEVEAVRFQGVEEMDEAVLTAVLETRATRCRSALFFLFCLLDADWALERAFLDSAALERDVERLNELYRAWGFPDARVGAEVVLRNGDRVDVVFEVFEGEPITVASLEIEGLDSLDPPVELETEPALEVDGPYALPLLEATRQQVVLAFAERGHPYPQIEVEGDVDEVTRRARVVMRVEPGPAVVFGEPRIEAEPPIGESAVRERLAFEPGDPFRPSALAESERRIHGIAVVDSVTIEAPGLATGELVIDPTIVVGAGRTQAVQLEGTVSSSQCLQAAGVWSNRYFLGAPRVFTITAGVANLLADQLSGFPCTSGGEDEYAKVNYFVRAQLLQPWPGSPRTQILASAFAARETAPFVYVQRGYGGQLGVVRELRPELIGALRYSPQRNALSAADVYFCGNYGICEPDRLADLTDYTWLSPLQAQAFWTPTGPPMLLRPALPGERWRRWANGASDFAAGFTGSEYEYGRVIGEGGLTRLYGERYELAGRARLGLVADWGELLPPQVRLYSGGANTVRGVPQNFLGPKFLLVSAERAEELGCELVPDGCPSGVTIGSDRANVRPAGGEAVVELNLEGRVWIAGAVQAVAFADYGMLRRRLGGGNRGLFGSDAWETLITPGIGVRVPSPLGPVRIDVAYNPMGSRAYPLFTRDPETRELIPLGSVRYAPFTYDDPDGLREFWRRLQFQLAIGQPF